MYRYHSATHMFILMAIERACAYSAHYSHIELGSAHSAVSARQVQIHWSKSPAESESDPEETKASPTNCNNIFFFFWVRKWKQHDGPELTKKLVDVLRACEITLFPNIRILLQLTLTIPTTSCECERIFSQLKLTKTPRRSTTSADRLSGLAMMINRARYESPARLNKLVQTFHQLHSRRLKLPFILSD